MGSEIRFEYALKNDGSPFTFDHREKSTDCDTLRTSTGTQIRSHQHLKLGWRLSGDACPAYMGSWVQSLAAHTKKSETLGYQGHCQRMKDLSQNGRKH